jgi:hypothetical protein
MELTDQVGLVIQSEHRLGVSVVTVGVFEDLLLTEEVTGCILTLLIQSPRMKTCLENLELAAEEEEGYRFLQN